jgi:hypothetical protein
MAKSKQNGQGEAETKASYVNETTTGIQARLPKLEIAEFDGSYMDWLRFWGQFEEIVGKTNVANISKLAYLRGLLCKRVRRSIEALPFTAEGYNHTKTALPPNTIPSSENNSTRGLSRVHQMSLATRNSTFHIRR